MLLFLSLLAFVISILLFTLGLQHLYRQSILGSTRTLKIEDVVSGMVEIQGIVGEASGTVQAPFSGKQCLYAEFVLEENRGTPGEEQWEIVEVGRFGRPFSLSDDTGEMLVDPEGANLETSDSFFTEHHRSRIPSEEVKKAGERLRDQFPDCDDRWNMNYFRNQQNRDLRFSENIIRPGDSAWILGRAVPAHKGRNIYYPDQYETVVYGGGTTPAFVISEIRPRDVIDYNTSYLPLLAGGCAAGFIGIISLFAAFGG